MPGSLLTGQKGSSRSVLFITGPIASGKTSIADALAGIVPRSGRATFSSALRALAAAEGVDVGTREQLQDYGEAMVRSRWRQLWSATLEMAQPPGAVNLIVDGLRHLHIYEALRGDNGLRVGMLTVIPAPVVLEARMRTRDELAGLASHPVESQWERLAVTAQVTLRDESAADPDLTGLVKSFGWLWR